MHRQYAKTKVAVVGAGYWGKNLVRNFHTLGVLAAICDSDDSSRTVCAGQYPDVRCLGDFEDVLSDQSITAVAIATPASVHFTMTRAALHAGKDVFVEKPLALEVDQGRELVDLAKRTGRILMVGHILRYHPAIVRLQEMIHEGSLGKLQYIYSNRLNIGKIRTEEDILWSFAPHDVSAILGLLGETPSHVASQGGAYLSQEVADATMSQLRFSSGVQGHIFVSWLHPFKEQRLVVVGSQKMAVFDDTSDKKLVLYSHKVEWKNRVPTAVKAAGEHVELEAAEPLERECRHFLDCVCSRTTPVTSGEEGLRVLQVLDACRTSLIREGAVVAMADRAGASGSIGYFAHESAYVDKGAIIGAGSKVWHFSHIMNGASIGERCVVGQNVNVDSGASIGNNVKIQNNVSIYSGVTIEDDVFLGPSCVLTNVSNPRSQVSRHSLYEATILRRGCSVGANATVVCGVTVGQYAFVAAGSVVTRSVPDYALVMGNPARQVGWMSRHGHRLQSPDGDGIMRCPESGLRYQVDPDSQLRCIDLDEGAALPSALSRGTARYRQFK